MILSLFAMVLVIGLTLRMIDVWDVPGIRKQVIIMTLPSTLLLYYLSIDIACRFVGC